MFFRLSDGAHWSSAPFEARSADDLARGIRRAWLEALRPQDERGEPAQEGTPLICLRRRMRAIDEWEQIRLLRTGVADDLRRQWAIEADHKRTWARRTAGTDRALYLQVEADDGRWYEPAPAGRRSRLSYASDLYPAHCAQVLDRARETMEFLDALDLVAASMHRWLG